MVFAWLIRFLVVMLVVRLLWKFLGGLVRGAAARPQVSPPRGVPLVRDPVCGTYVDQARALTLRRQREMHYFCSDDCRTAFKQARRASARGA